MSTRNTAESNSGKRVSRIATVRPASGGDGEGEGETSEGESPKPDRDPPATEQTSKERGEGDLAHEAPSNRRMIRGTNNGQPDALDPGDSGDAYNP